MKNLKTKVGVSLATLAFFATIGLTSGSTLGLHSGLPPIEGEKVTKRDPDVMKVVETLKKTSFVDGYQTSEKTITFDYKDKSVLSEDKNEFLELQIYKINKKKGTVGNKIVIKDYDLDNLDSKDVIIHFRTVTRNYLEYEWAEDIPEYVKFSELSGKTQQEIRKAYNKIIKEAPEKLLKDDETYKRSLKQQEEQKNKKLEEDILSIIR